MRATCPEHLSRKAEYTDMAFDPNRSFDDLPALPPASEPHCHTRDCRSSASWRIPNNATLINAAPPARNAGGSRDREHRDTGRPAVPPCQRLPAIGEPAPVPAGIPVREPAPGPLPFSRTGTPPAWRVSARSRTVRLRRRKADALCRTGMQTPLSSIHGDRMSGPAVPNTSHPIGSRRTGIFVRSCDVTPKCAVAGARPVATQP